MSKNFSMCCSVYSSWQLSGKGRSYLLSSDQETKAQVTHFVQSHMTSMWQSQVPTPNHSSFSYISSSKGWKINRIRTQQVMICTREPDRLQGIKRDPSQLQYWRDSATSDVLGLLLWKKIVKRQGEKKETRVGKDVDMGILAHHWWDCKMVRLWWKHNWRVPQEIKGLAIPLLGIEQQRIESRISNRNFYVPVHGSISHYC